MIAQVVPLRRLPLGHSWFDYDIPENLQITVGDLVEISFRRQTTMGVVWDISKNSEVTTRQPILRVMRPGVMTTWQKQVMMAMAETGAVSLGHIAASIIPDWPKSPRQSKKQTAIVQPPGSAGEFPDVKTWWYRSRQQALQWLVAWASQPGTDGRVIILPTHHDVRILEQQCLTAGLQPLVVTGQHTPATYRQLYEQIQAHPNSLVVGTLPALSLPWPQTPAIIIDQEEHPQHKQTSQHPRLDVRAIVRHLQLKVVATTPAPSLDWWQQYKPVPPEVSNHRQMISLDRPGIPGWLSPELEDLITQASPEKPLLLIAPRRGYASAISCRDCGYLLTCPNCQERISFSAPKLSSTECRHCGHRVQLPADCPKCHGVAWQFIGQGISKIEETLKKEFPTIVINTISAQGELGSQRPEASIWLGAYGAYRVAEKNVLSSIVLVQADALRNIPDFSAQERAWQYLARVEAAIDVPVVAQTYTPHDPFWQRWLHSEDQAWYEAEIDQRRAARMPPTVDQWMAILPHPENTEVQAKIAQLKQYTDYVSVSELPNSITPRRYARLLITANGQRPLRDLLPWMNLFPTPWQLDMSVNSWLAE